MAAAQDTKQEVQEFQVSIRRDNVAALSADGRRLADISPDGIISAYTTSIQVRPASEAEQIEQADGAKILSIASNFNEVALPGAKFFLDDKDNLIVFTDHKVTLRHANGTVEKKQPAATQRAAAPAYPKIVLPADVKDPYDIGTKMKDGTIYAGISPDKRTPMFVMPKDEIGPTRLSWLKDTIARFNRKKKYKHDDWRLPTFAELYVLYLNQNKGLLSKTFNSKAGLIQGCYYSSTEAKDDCLWTIKFNNGSAKPVWKEIGECVRLVSTPQI